MPSSSRNSSMRLPPGPQSSRATLKCVAARVSQVMGLLCLSPVRREEVLGMVAVYGVEPMAGRRLRDETRLWAWT